MMVSESWLPVELKAARGDYTAFFRISQALIGLVFVRLSMGQGGIHREQQPAADDSF